jgi:hypothetical protein
LSVRRSGGLADSPWGAPTAAPNGATGAWCGGCAQRLFSRGALVCVAQVGGQNGGPSVAPITGGRRCRRDDHSSHICVGSARSSRPMPRAQGKPSSLRHRPTRLAVAEPEPHLADPASAGCRRLCRGVVETALRRYDYLLLERVLGDASRTVAEGSARERPDRGGQSDDRWRRHGVLRTHSTGERGESHDRCAPSEAGARSRASGGEVPRLVDARSPGDAYMCTICVRPRMCRPDA